MILRSSSIVTYAKNRQRSVLLQAVWECDRVVIRNAYHQHTDGPTAHLFPEELMGGVPGCPTIETLEVGENGIGCTICGRNAAGAPFSLMAERADFVEGVGLTFLDASRSAV